MAAQGSMGAGSTHKEKGNVLLCVANIFKHLCGDTVLPCKSALESLKQ